MNYVVQSPVNSSTKRSRQRRASLYVNKGLHNELKERDRKRKNLANYVAANKRKTDKTGTSLRDYRKNQREAKQRYRAKLSLQKEKRKTKEALKYLTPQNSKIKNLKRRLRRKRERKKMVAAAEKSETKREKEIQATPMLVSQTLP